MAISANVFHNAANTIFKVFAELAHSATYVSVTNKDDFEGSTPTEVPTTIDVIIETLAERDTQFLSFSNLLQPTDVKGLVKGRQLASTVMGTEDKVLIADVTYHVVAYTTDPAEAVYTLYLRKV